jgi:hypothetical protein
MLVAYSVLALFGVVGTWWFNVLSFSSDQAYLAGWFANPASSSAAVDVSVVAIAACLFMVVESRRLGMSRLAWALLPLTFAIAVAFTFPLFLAWREWHLRHVSDPAPAGPAPADPAPAGDAPGLHRTTP